MLKRFEDLTSEEILNISNEELEKYIDIELLLKGIVPVEEPDSSKINFKDPEIEVTGYEISLFQGIVFKTMEDTLKVISAIKDIDVFNIDKKYNWNAPSSKELNVIMECGKLPDLKINILSLVSKEEYEKYKTSLEKYKLEIEGYNNQLNLYNEYTREVYSIRKEFERIIERERKTAQDIQTFNLFMDYYSPKVGLEQAIINLYKQEVEYSNNNPSFSRKDSLEKFIDENGYKEIIKKYQEQEGSENDY